MEALNRGIRTGSVFMDLVSETGLGMKKHRRDSESIQRKVTVKQKFGLVYIVWQSALEGCEF